MTEKVRQRRKPQNKSKIVDAGGSHGDAVGSVPETPALMPAKGFDVPALKGLSLDELAAGINARLPEIDSSVCNARAQAAYALRVAVETGHYLNAAKQQTEKGQWLVWLARHCPGLAQATAYRYQRLAQQSANLSHVINGKPANGIRQAYRAVGILPDEPASKKKAPDLDAALDVETTDLLAKVKSFTAFLRGVCLGNEEKPVWEQLKQALSALAVVCSEVEQKVSERVADGKKGRQQ